MCGNFVCWADLFVFDWLISAGDGLLCMPMEMGHVSTGTADFVVRVDKKLWVKNCISFFGTQGAIFDCKSFVCTHWVVLPDEFTSCSSSLGDWGWISLCHGIGLQSVWCVNPISCQFWQDFGLHWSVVAFQLWNSIVCFPCALSCVFAFDFVNHCWIPAHVLAATGNISSNSAIAGWRFKVLGVRLGRLWVSWTDLIERFLQGWWICGETQTLSTIGGWICLWWFWWLSGLVQTRCWNVQCKSRLFSSCCIRCWNCWPIRPLHSVPVPHWTSFKRRHRHLAGRADNMEQQAHSF